MRTPRRPDRRPATILGLIALVATALVLVAPVRGAGESAVEHAVAAWRGAFGERPQATVGERVIVVLSAPSLADHVAVADSPPSAEDERRWVGEAQAAQRILVARLSERGVEIRPLRTFTRTLNGFSALLDSRARSELERVAGVQGVYPVRLVYPAFIGSETLSRRDFRAGAGHRPDVSVPGFDGRGITIALLDTGVVRTRPGLRGRVLAGVDVLSGRRGAVARGKPGDPREVEAHGTRMAGIILGSPAEGVQGVAPAARLLPIRVLGWQRASDGSESIFSRGDVLLSGLERAVDPDGNGDTGDAADIALAPLVEPFAAFADSPETRAVAGAARLGTLVVAAAGNDGRSGRAGFGSVGAPGGAAAALTVGALDARRELPLAKAVLSAGSETLLDGPARLLGAVAPRKSSTLAVSALLGPSLAIPDRPPSAAADGSVLADFFDREGVSRVAGHAALVPAGRNLVTKARNAAAAGASALLVSGTQLPAGALDLDQAAGLPVLAVSARAARAAVRALAAGKPVTLSLGAARFTRNPDAGRVAPFSSGGLVFDGRAKPDLVAPAIGIATLDAGVDADGSPRVATVTGTSAGAAVVAGAAALVAQARPGLTPSELESLLVGSARRLGEDTPSDPVTAQGAGLVDPAAALATEIAVEPTSLAFGRADGSGWKVLRGITVRNLSTRRLAIGFGVTRDAWGDPELSFAASPAALSLRPGASADVILEASAAGKASGHAGGAFVVQPEGSRAVRVPWAVSFRTARVAALVGQVRLSNRVFEPSSSAPVVLAFRAGRLHEDAEGGTIEPVQTLEAELWTAQGKRLGVLFRMRDLLPGRYAFGLTGRGPEGRELRPGDYVVRLKAIPVEGENGGHPSSVKVRFTISG